MAADDGVATSSERSGTGSQPASGNSGSEATSTLPPGKGDGPETEDPAAEALEVEAPDAGGPDAGGPGVEGPGVEGPGVESPGVEGPGVESPGVEARDADAPDAGVPDVEKMDRAWPYTVAAIVSPSVSSRLRRDPGAAAETSPTTEDNASPGVAPARRRTRISAHSSALSVGASRVSRSRGGIRQARAAALSGQPTILPLWLNSQRSKRNGAAADSVTGMPTVAERTAASTALECVAEANAGRSASVHSGRHRRYRSGFEAFKGNQPTPKPSALMVPPPRMSWGAHACRESECGDVNSRSASGIGGPRYAR
jgi:hypothetical protein